MLMRAEHETFLLLLDPILIFTLFQFDCCGVSTYENWNENEYFNCTAGNISPLKCTVPYSCCKILDTVLVKNTNYSTILTLKCEPFNRQ